MKKEISEICRKHDLGEVLSLEVVKEGVLNENCIIFTTKGKFFLKYCKNKTAEQIRYILQIERFMKKASVPAVEAIHVDEIQGWMLYPFIESDRSHSYSINDYYLMGQALGHIHSVSFDMKISEELKEIYYKDNQERSTTVERMEEHVKQIKQKENLDETDNLFLSYIDKKLSYVKKIEEPQLLSNDTLIHGDFHAGNLLIEENTRKIIGICDWEKSRYAPRSYDLARAYLYIGFGTNIDDALECLKISESVLSGYRSVIQISDEEFRQGLLMRLRHNVFTTWIEDKYYLNNDDRANKFLKSSILTLDYFLRD